MTSEWPITFVWVFGYSGPQCAATNIEKNKKRNEKNKKKNDNNDNNSLLSSHPLERKAIVYNSLLEIN